MIQGPTWGGGDKGLLCVCVCVMTQDLQEKKMKQGTAGGGGDKGLQWRGKPIKYFLLLGYRQKGEFWADGNNVTTHLKDSWSPCSDAHSHWWDGSGGKNGC